MKIFKKHPKLKKYYRTSDGTAFFNEQNATTHARSLEDKRIKEVFRDDAKETKDDVKSKTASEIIELINSAESLEALAEFEADTRKTVIAALAEKKAAFNSPIQKELKPEE